MMILSMLEEGKIDSEEAVKLLEALEESEIFMPQEENNEKNKFIDMGNTKEKMEEFGKVIKEQGRKVEDIGVDLGNKISEIFLGMKDNKGLEGLLGGYETINTSIEKDISNIENPSIDFKSINGSIVVENWAEDHMLIKINCKYKNRLLAKNDDFFNFYHEENRLVFRPKFENKIMINLKVYLPDRAYDEINLSSTNGQMKVEDFELNNLFLSTTNASVIVEDIKSQKISIETKNGRIYLNDISSPILEANTTNSNIAVEDIKCDELSVFTKNGRILISDILSNHILATTTNASIEASDMSSKEIVLTTSNGKITLEDVNPEKIQYLKLSTSNASIDAEIGEINKGSYFDLETSLGNIDLEVSDLVYKVNNQVNLGKKNIVAHSVDLNEEEKYLRLFASTSNGSIKIW